MIKSKYTVKKNKMNDCKYIVFKKGLEYYKAMIMSDSTLYIWIDISAFKGECYNLQLLKTLACNCDKSDYECIYNNAINWLG